jgi:pyrimidine-specific ribonucleoside hydrolase
MRRWVTIAAGLLLLVTACEGAASTSTSPADVLRHVVLDTDLAFDDIMALLYLTQREDVAIDAVTIAGTGEAHCEPGVENAKALLALGGSPDTPVACGRETPLEGTNAFPDEWRAAVDDLSMLDLPEVDPAPDPRGAVGLLRDTLDGDATLITLGPLTNVAEALREDPGLADRVPALVAMAGAVDVAGNAPGGVAEYNVWVDPLAAREVIEGMDVRLVPLDATNHVPFTAFFVRALDEHIGTPEADAVAAIVERNEGFFLSGGYSFWDPLAAVLALEDELATWEEVAVSVMVSAGTAGWIDRAEGGSPVRFATDVPDPIAFESEYLSVLAGEPVDATRPDATLTVTFDGDSCSLSTTEVVAGTNDVAFTSETGRDDVGAVVISFAREAALGEDELRALIGPAGSRVDTRREELADLAVVGSLTELTPVEIPAGDFLVACAQGGPRPRVWLSPTATAT